MSLWQGRASRAIGTAALALAVLAAPGSLAFARGGGYGGGGHHAGRGYHHGGGYSHHGSSYSRGYGGFGSVAPYFYGSRAPYSNGLGYAYPSYGYGGYGYGYGGSGFMSPNSYFGPAYRTSSGRGYCR